MINKDTIINFGFPCVLKELDLEFCFDAAFADKKSVSCGYHCEEKSVKFFLYDHSNDRSVFTMDFYIRDYYKNRAFGGPTICEPHIHLQHIATNNKFRKQGIATFYIEKLINFCNENDIHIITLHVAPPSRNKVNSLNRAELTRFYESFSTDSVKIILL